MRLGTYHVTARATNERDDNGGTFDKRVHWIRLVTISDEVADVVTPAEVRAGDETRKVSSAVLFKDDYGVMEQK